MRRTSCWLTTAKLRRPARRPPRPCGSTPAPTTPDIVIGFAAEADADYRLFVRSRWLTPESAAALFAAAKVSARKVAGRE